MARAQAPAAVRSRITQPIDETNRITLRGNTHPLARAQYDQGAVADSQPINRMLLLLQRSSDHETSLRSLLDAQQSKSSGSYHQWLSPQQFGQQFGASDGDVATVTAWLQSHGFQVAGVSAGRTVIEFSGNAGQVRSAFNTQIHRYLVNGEMHLANSTDPQIPAALAAVVAGPVSLHNFTPKALSRTRGVFSRSKETGQVKPLLTVTCSPPNCPTQTTYYALGPADFAKIYNVPTAGNGNPTGGNTQTIAIVGDSEICTENSPDFATSCTSDDVQAFRNLFGLPVISPACPAPGLSGGPVCVILDGPDPGLTGDEIEGDLDTQWSNAIAPSATVDFVIAEDTEASAGILLASEYIVNNNLAPIVSESFGACEAFIGLEINAFQNYLWEQAAAQGMSVVVSAGDAGSAGCEDSDAYPPNEAVNGNNVNGLASTPFNVAAGGTDFDINLPTANTYASTYWNPQDEDNVTTGESALSYIPEIPWNDSCAQSLSSPPVATGCSPPSSEDFLLTVGGGGGESNCLNASINGEDLITACGSASALTGSNLAGYPKPSWQSGSYVTGAASTDGLRDLPDISLFAAAGYKSNSFYAVCEADEGGSCLGPDYPFLGVGGTSSSAPSFAGIMALVVNQQGVRQGNPNYVLYALADKQASSPPTGGCNSTSSPNTTSSTGCTFYDVTLGDNSQPCLTGSRDCVVSGGGDYGVVENPSGTIAFDAGTGYDLATGLGTINVTNLIGKWNSVAGNFTPTTTTLCLIAAPGTTCANPILPVTITHGTQVNGQVTLKNGAGTSVISVTNSAATPEMVSLIGSGGNLPGGTAAADPFVASDYEPMKNNAFPLTSGLSSFATDYLVGGTSYTVTAHYAGDGTNGASTSPGIMVTVNAEPSTTSTNVGIYYFDTEPPEAGALPVISGTATAYYGDSILLRADVTGNASHQETGTGSVTFRDNGNLIGSFPLNTEGYAEDQTGSTIDGVTNIAALAVGSHSVQAVYNGDNSYCPSSDTVGSCTGTAVSAAVGFNVVAAPTIIGTYVSSVFQTSVVASTPLIAPGTSITVASGTNVTLQAFVDTANGNSPSSGGSSGAFLSGTVTFTCTPNVASCGSATPASSFTSNANTYDGYGFVAGVATLAFSPTATTTVTATFTPTGSNYVGSTTLTSATITVSSSAITVSPLPAAGTTIAIASPGLSANTSITASSTVFTGNVTLTCTVAPEFLSSVSDLPTCEFELSGTENNVIALNQGSNPPVQTGTRSLVVNSTAETAVRGPIRPQQDGPNNRLLPEVAASLLALSLILFWAWGVPARRLRGMVLLGALVVVATVGAVSCGGGSSSGSGPAPSTTPGTTVTSYLVTVTATPSSGTAVQTVVQVNVN